MKAQQSGKFLNTIEADSEFFGRQSSELIGQAFSLVRNQDGAPPSYCLSEEVRALENRLRSLRRNIKATIQEIAAYKVLIEESNEEAQKLLRDLETLPKDIEYAENRCKSEAEKKQALVLENEAIMEQSTRTTKLWSKKSDAYKASMGFEIVTSDCAPSETPVSKIIFTHIDPKAPQKEFYFSLKVEQNDYIGVESVPDFPEFQKLCEAMNKGELKIAPFMCMMRKCFKRYAQQQYLKA